MAAFGPPDPRRLRATLTALAVCASAAVLTPAALADGMPPKTPSSASPPSTPSTAALSTESEQQYTTQPGDTIWEVARRHGVDAAALARASGRSLDATLAPGAELKIPPRLPPAGANGRLRFSSQTPIYSPRGPAFLAPGAARAWEQMRQASLRELGINLYPFGPDSAYRSYGKQVEQWRIFKAGGPEAAPPGTSAHGLGKAVDLASPEMRRAIDALGRRFGWAKIEAPSEWNHVNYVGS